MVESCPTCGDAAVVVEGKDERWCNKCLSWFATPQGPNDAGSAASVSNAPGAPVAGFKPGRVAEAEGPGGALAALGVFFWLLEGLFVALGIAAIVAGWTKVGIALIVFAFFGGLFLIF